MAGEERDPQVLAYLREKYRLDDPIPVQYFVWLGQVVQGNLGVSLRTDIPVLELILGKLPVTIELAVFAMIVALAIGIPTGILSAVKKGTSVDYAANVVALSGLSIPNFWLGILLIMLVSVRWQLAAGLGLRAAERGSPALNIKTMIMPAFVLGTGLAASLMRHTRSAMLGVLRSDYVRTARAKGLLSRAVVLKHALRNALIPIVTLSTLLFGELLAGAVLTEQIFTIPGFGKLDRRCRVQPRLRGRSGRRPLHGSRVHLHEPSRRCPLCSGQSAPEARHMTHRSSRKKSHCPKRRNRVLAKFLDNRSAVLGGAVVAVLRHPRDRRAAGRAVRSDQAELHEHPQGALGDLLVRHRRTRPRHALAHDLGRARLAHGRRRLGRDRDAARRTLRPHVRLFRRLGRRDDLARRPKRCWRSRS